MSKSIAILVVHGMGDTDDGAEKPKFHNKLQKRLIKELGDNWNKIHLEPVYWQPVLQPNEDAVWDRMQDTSASGHKLRYKFLREFMLFGFADAGTMEYSRTMRDGAYEKVQKVIYKSFKKALAKLESPNSPVIVIAQSLGCQVMSNYIYDASKEDNIRRGMWKSGEPFGVGTKPQGAEQDFLRGETIKYFLTTGCNIPLFVAGLDKIIPINKPNPDFVWENYFDLDDVLGFPLKPLSEEYEAIVDDIKIDSGSFYSSWTPISHSDYWTDSEFYIPVKNKILTLLNQL